MWPSLHVSKANADSLQIRKGIQDKADLVVFLGECGVGKELSAKRLCLLPFGTEVLVKEVEGRRARISWQRQMALSTLQRRLHHSAVLRRQIRADERGEQAL